GPSRHHLLRHRRGQRRRFHRSRRHPETGFVTRTGTRQQPPGVDFMSDQLSFALNNPAAPGTVYVSTNAADNKLTLVITSTADASFTAGVVVPIDQADQGTGSLLYLDLSSLGLTEPEFHALTLDGTGWAFALYYSASSQVIGFTPTAPVSLSPADTIRLSLDNFTLGKIPPNPPLHLLPTSFPVRRLTP